MPKEVELLAYVMSDEELEREIELECERWDRWDGPPITNRGFAIFIILIIATMICFGIIVTSIS